MDLLNDFFRAPLYVQIENLIEEKILSSEYLPGEQLPSERKLAETYGVNRMTVKKALNLLVQKGTLIRKQGSGTFVKQHGVNDKLYFDLSFTETQSSAGITELFKTKGIEVENRVLGTEVIEGFPYLAKKLNLKTTEQIFVLNRVRETEKNPFAIEHSYIPYSIFSDATTIDFKTIGLYDYMKSKKHQPVDVLQRIQILNASSKEARLMKIVKGSLLFFIQYISLDKQNNIVEYTESYLNPDEIKLKFTIGYDSF